MALDVPKRIFAVLYVSVMGLTRCYKSSSSSSAVADKPVCRAASRLTAKFYNSHVTITTPFCRWYVILLLRIDIAYSRTKFDDFRLSRSSDMIGAPKFCNGSHDLTMPQSLNGDSLSSVGCDLHIQPLHQIRSLCDRQLRRCRCNTKCINWGGLTCLEVTQGHQQHNHLIERIRLPIQI